MRSLFVIILLHADDVICCDKEWMRGILMSVCSYSKRSILKSESQEMLKIVDTEIDFLYSNKLSASDPYPATQKDERSVSLTEQEKDHGWLTHGLSPEMVFLLHPESRKEFNWRRELRATATKLIKACCVSICTFEDVRGICGKK